MKQLRLIRNALMAVALALLTDCSTEPESHARHSCCPTTPPTPETKQFTDRSLYQLDSTWTTDAGRTIKLGALEGRVQVVAMFFANCQAACPLLVNDMKRIEAALSPELRGHIGFLLVTFDVERDTPEVLHNYRSRQQLPADTWTLLHGGTDDILELAALLGVKFKKDVRGQFAHSNIITVLDAKGEILHQQTGLAAPIGSTLIAIRQTTSAAQLP